jgi:predicted HicB family RNase H-like nuclease
MTNVMTYKGYSARIEYDDEDGILVGHISGIRDIVGFHAQSVTELKTAFQDAVDDYLAACEQLGQLPDKPSSGKILLRVPPETHRAALISAEMAGKSLNQWANDILQTALFENTRHSINA